MMIKIAVVGDTYRIRNNLKELGFRWFPTEKQWAKITEESTLNSTIETIRPQLAPLKLTLTLTKVDLEGNKLSDREVQISLRERAEADYLKLFNQHIVNQVQVIAHNCSSAPRKDRDKRRPDDAFY